MKFTSLIFLQLLFLDSIGQNFSFLEFRNKIGDSVSLYSNSTETVRLLGDDSIGELTYLSDVFVVQTQDSFCVTLIGNYKQDSYPYFYKLSLDKKSYLNTISEILMSGKEVGRIPDYFQKEIYFFKNSDVFFFLDGDFSRVSYESEIINQKIKSDFVESVSGGVICQINEDLNYITVLSMSGYVNYSDVKPNSFSIGDKVEKGEIIGKCIKRKYEVTFYDSARTQ
jgi:hypothetical protein